jgi:hypothetical protein
LAACNRFGIDSPCPIITKRLHNYGNNEEIKTQFDEMARKFREKIPEAFDVNSDMYPVADLNRSGDLDD